MGTGTTTGGITIQSTTADPTIIKVPDTDYAYILALKELTEAIRFLSRRLK
jgi:hypothetical protein